MTLNEGAIKSVSLELLEADDEDTDNSTLTYTLTTAAANGQLENTDNSGVAITSFTQQHLIDGKIQYVHNDSNSTSDSFGFKVADGVGNELTNQTFTISITAIDDAPEISGMPDIEILEGNLYSFTPQASDLDEDPLTFIVSGLPAWLSFNELTGKISGTPAYEHVGSYGPITMSVSDDSLSAALEPFFIEVIARDTDGDGLADGQELMCGLDINVADADLDNDGDGVSNGDECLNGTNPAIDDMAPDLVLPADMAVDATALWTKVDLGTAEAFDYVDGVRVACCTAQLTSLIDERPFFAPGITRVVWQAVDEAGNISTAEQVVKVRPLISFSKDQSVSEGNEVEVKVMLNGPSPTYPVEIDYTVSGYAVEGEDHDLASGTVVIEEGLETSITVSILADEQDSEGTEDIVLTMTGDINKGNQNTHTITITSENIAPELELVAMQAGEVRSDIAIDGGLVTVIATVTDHNSNDVHQIDWTPSDALLVDQSDDIEHFVFEPASLTPGIYTLSLNVDDNGSPVMSTQKALRLKVVAALAILGTDDSDGDGISDQDEGHGDSDQDGIPDYQDAIAERNVLQERSVENAAYLVECDPGVRCSLGGYALLGEHLGVQITAEDIAEEGDDLIADTYTNVGGIFDFEIHKLPDAGQSARVVIPQRAAIPENGVYRKFMNGQWITFIEDANNTLMSAPGEPGFCPPPGENVYREGLNEGDWCVQITLEDGGPNDADSQVNGSVIDPGGVSIAPETPVVTNTQDQAKSGGRIGWLLSVLLTAALMIRRANMPMMKTP